jgi:cation-transporting P-type ATPase C
MVGDGINDALALTTADIGVAVGAGGAEVALQAADIALMDSDLAKLAALRLLSRKTLRIIEQNFWLAISTNLLGSALALSGRLTPVMGGVLHIAHTLGIMANSGRLTGWKPPATEL